MRTRGPARRDAARSAAALCALALAGCDAPLALCDSSTVVLYDPAARQLDLFPDDFFLADDPDSPTGRRVRLRPGIDIELDRDAEDAAGVFDQVSELDGFGTTADLFFRISGPVDAESLGSGVWLVALDPTPRRVPARLRVVPEVVPEPGEDPAAEPGVTVIVDPSEPLRPQTLHGLAITAAAHDAAGLCLAPSPAMADKLRGAAGEAGRADLERLVGSLVELGAIAGAGELGAAVTFTTGVTLDTSRRIAEDVRRRVPTYRSHGPCVATAAYRRCDGELDAWDYRGADHLLVEGAAPAPTAVVLQVVVYLPLALDGPFPTLIYGHGLSSDRTQGGVLADFAAPAGIATVAIDAVLHGDYPQQPRTPNNTLALVLEFFGMDLGSDTLVDGRQLRDHLRQSTYDKLQLIELLRQGVDADGDGTDDVGIAPLGYLGVSLGGIMAAELLAFAPEVQAAVIMVPGAEVGDIIQFSGTFRIFVELFRGSASDGDVARYFPLLQTVLDRGDPAAYGPHVLRDRLPGLGAATPHVLTLMVLDDSIIPNDNNLAFAEALGLPFVGDRLLPDDALPAGPALPTAGNLGGVSAGLFQYDVVYVDAGPELEPATHDNVGNNPITIDQVLHFLLGAFAGATPELVDPYRRLGVKP